MDFVSHTLWGGAALGRRSRRAFLGAATVSLLPDLLTEGLFTTLSLMNVGAMPDWSHGHPNVTAYPTWAQTLYSGTHSLVVFTLAFVLVWVLARRPVWVVAAWGVHVLLDIPTHSLALFPTPFLWPLSDFKVDGLGWDNPAVLGANALLLVTLYSFWLCRSKRRRRG